MHLTLQFSRESFGALTRNLREEDGFKRLKKFAFCYSEIEYKPKLTQSLSNPTQPDVYQTLLLLLRFNFSWNDTSWFDYTSGCDERLFFSFFFFFK